MFFRHAVNIVAEVESEIGHVEHAVATEDTLQAGKRLVWAQYLLYQIERELIVAGWHQEYGS
jgi:hypothetical protein